MVTYPLTPSQEGILLECLSHPATTSYNLPFYSCLSLDIDADRLERALSAIIAKRFVLRARIIFDGDKPRQYFAEEVQGIERLTMPETDVMNYIRNQFIQPWTFDGKPFSRFAIVTTEEHHWLLMDVMHLYGDGNTMLNLLLQQDIALAYAGDNLPEESMHFGQWAELENATLGGEQYQQARDYYLKELQGAEFVTFSHHLPETPLAACLKQSEYLDRGKVEEWCKQQGVKPQHLTMSAYALVLGRYARTQSPMFCTVKHGRQAHQMDIYGLFVRTEPVLMKMDNTMTVREWIDEARQNRKDSYRHEAYPFIRLCEELSLKPSTYFAFQGDYQELLSLDGHNWEMPQLMPQQTQEDLQCRIYCSAEYYEARFEASAAFYTEDELSRIASAYKHCIEQMMQHPEGQLGDIALVDEEEQEALRLLGCGKQTHEDTTLTVIDLFRQQVAATPDNLAIVYQEIRLTYRELDEISDHLAAWMQREKHLEPGQVVGLCIGRSERMAIYPLAVMKAGGTYMPLDPHFPADRIQFMCQDAEVRFVLDDSLDLSQLPDELPQPVVNAPEDAMVILFTSGTTGRPKGVVLEHRSLLNFFRWYVDEFDMTAADRAVAYANFGFDAHMMDLYPALICGASCWIIPSDMRMDMVALNDYMNANGLNVAFFTTQIGHLIATSVDNRSLRLMSVGGEKLQSCRKPERYRFYNGYGPTECSLYSTFYNVEDHFDAKHSYIGRPLSNYQLWVMDQAMQPVPQGVPGELCIGGKCLAREYLNQPELTAQKFIYYQGERLYRSGDLVRWSEDGNMEFLGRVDHQVKLRGLRIELEEIESQCASYEGVLQAVAMVCEINGVEQLCLYYTVRPAENCPKETFEKELQLHLQSVLADYMVPTHYIRLEEMPLNANGKISRQMLPVPTIEESAYVAPSSEIEQQLESLLCGLLHTEQLSVERPLIVAGMTSIMAMKLSSAIFSSLQVKVSVKEILTAGTIRVLAQQIESAGIVAASTEKRYEKRDNYALSQNQLGVYLDCEQQPHAIQYNIPVACRLAQGQDLDGWKTALEKVIDAHPALKARLAFIDGELCQTRHDEEPARVQTLTLEIEPDTAWFEQQLRPFDLMNETLYRCTLIKSPTAVYLFADIHHIVFDGTSESVLLKQLYDCYAGLEPETESYTAFEWADDMQHQMQSERFAEAEQYFDQLVTDTSSVSYPHASEPSGVGTIGVSRASVPLEPIFRWCRDHRVTENSFFLTVMAQVLHRTTREEDINFCTLSHGRNDQRLSENIGMFVQTQIAVSRYTAATLRQQTFAQAVQLMYQQSLETTDRDFYPFTVLSRRHEVRNEILFAYQGGILDAGEFHADLRSYEVGLGAAKMPLLVTVEPTPDGKEYSIRCEYDGQYYDATSMETLAQLLARYAQNACNETVRLAEIEMLDDEQKARIVQSGKGLQTDIDQTQTLVDLLRQQVALTPDNLAVVYGERRLTYRQVDEISDRLAAWLQKEHGVTAESVVGLCIHRSERIVLYALAVMKAGGAYLPIDPAFPEERRRFMANDARVCTVLDDSLDLSQLPLYELQQPALSPDNAFAVLYTSGSTGQPKGVVLEHRGIVNFCHWAHREFGVNAEDRTVGFTNFGFDVHMADLYPALTCGSSVWILPEEMRLDLQGMNQYMEANQLTVAYITTQVGHAFVQTIENHSLRLLSLAGEKLPPIRKPNYRLYNSYGPTEDTVYATTYSIEADYDHSLVGHPLDNYQVYIVDPSMNLVPEGVPGELLLGGVGIARGYLNMPELTEERFVEFMGQRVYRTGDLCRWKGGQVDYLGRIDRQVKLRGLRIELGEIEAQASQYPGIGHVAAEVRSLNGSEHLCLYYDLHDTAVSNHIESGLKEHLEKHLAEFMVPEFFVAMPVLPLNSNGKINRKALPDPELKSATTGYIAPNPGAETWIAESMQRILNLDHPVSAIDIFQSLGGDSIKAIRLVSLLRQQGLQLTVGQILSLKSPHAIAAACATVQESVVPIIAEQASWCGSVSNSGIVRWFFALNMPEPQHFNQSMMLRASRRIEEESLRQVLSVIVRHHDMLRAVANEGHLEVLPENEPVLYSLQVCDVPTEHAEEFIADRANAEQQSIDLEEGPLMRCVLFHLSDKEDALLMVCHHLVVDGVSWRIVLEDMNLAWRQLQEGKEIVLPAKGHSYRDYTEMLMRYRFCKQYAEEQEYWHQTDEKLRELGLLSVQTTKGKQEEVKGILDTHTTTLMTGVARETYQTEVNEILLTALSRSWKKWTGANTLSIQMEGHGREDITFEGQDKPLLLDRTVGWFTAIYPIVIEEIADDIYENIRLVKKVLSDVPQKGFGYLQMRRKNQKQILMPQVCLNYHGSFDEQAAENDLFRFDYVLPQGVAVSSLNHFGPDCSVDAMIVDGELHLYFHYNDSVWNQTQMQQLASTMIEELQQVVVYMMRGLSSQNIKVKHSYPLSPMQESILLETLLHPESTAYRMCAAIEMQLLPTEAQMEAVLEKLAERHPVLTTSIVHREVETYYQAQTDRAIALEYRSPEEDSAGEIILDAEMKREIDRGFDLQEDSLLRVVCLPKSHGCIVLFVMHHIIMDGWSYPLLLDDFKKLWSAEKLGAKIEDPKTSVYEKWVREVSTQPTSAAEDYWRNLLAGYENLAEIQSYESVESDHEASSHLYHHFSSADAETLNDFCLSEGVTVNNVVELAWGLTLQCYCRTNDVVYVKVVSGRSHGPEGIEDEVGLCINSVPVRVHTSSDMTILSALHRQQEQAAATSAFDTCSLAWIQSLSELGNNLFQSVLVFENYPGSETDEGEIRQIAFREETFNEITVAACPGSKDQFLIELEYDNSRFACSEMKLLLECFAHTIRGIVNNATKTMGQIPWVEAVQADQLITLGQGEKYTIPAEMTYVSMFISQAEKTPDHIAVVDETGSLTYRELNEQSALLSLYIMGKQGTNTGFVGIQLEPCKDFLIAALAVERAGMAYVPIDPSYPEERRTFMRDDCGAVTVIDAAYLQEWRKKDQNMMSQMPMLCSLNLSTPEGIAYMIYTSGSTGRPKGVTISHRAKCNLVAFLAKEWNLTADSRISCHSSFSFDASVEDLYPVLTVGGRVCIVPEEGRRDLDLLHDFIVKQGVTGGCYTTQLGIMLLQQFPDLPVEYLVLGGEKMNMRPKSPVRVINTYGPTEFTVDATWCEVPDNRGYRNIPIGRPLYNQAAYVLDVEGRLVPRGVIGELCLSGSQMANGYWNHQELTDQKFVIQTIGELDVKVYHTGDLVRWNMEGQLEYMGRIDNQVKLRGFRIELGEIESCISLYEGIGMVSVQVKEINGVQHLVAYITAGRKIEPDALQSFVAGRLADYMVPDVIVQLEEMPLMGSGKIDAKALPLPQLKNAEHVALTNEVEKTIAEAMAEVLHLDVGLGATDSFIALGGDSIKSIRLVNILRQKGCILTVAQVLKLRSVRALAAVAVSDRDQQITIEQESWSGKVGKTPILQWFFEQEWKIAGHYNQALALKSKIQLEKEDVSAILDKVVEHHDMLRAVVEAEGLFVRSLSEGSLYQLEEHTLANSAEVETIADNLHSGIDLHEGPLMHVALLHLPDGDYLLVSIHHLVVDGVSWRILTDDLNALMSQRQQGKPLALPQKSHSFQRYSEALANYAESEKLKRELPYWQGVCLQLSALAPKASEQPREMRNTDLWLPEEISIGHIQTLSGVYYASVEELLLTAVVRGYNRLRGTNSLTVEMEGHGRETFDEKLIVDRTVGWFTTVYPLVLNGVGHDERSDIRLVKEALRSVPMRGFGYSVLQYLSNQLPHELIPMLGFNYMGEMENGEESALLQVSTHLPLGKMSAEGNVSGPSLTYNIMVEEGRLHLYLTHDIAILNEKEAAELNNMVGEELQSLLCHLQSVEVPEHTASDLGCTIWSDDEYCRVVARLSNLGIHLQRVYPLTAMQQGMLLQALAQPDSAAYNTALHLSLSTLPTEGQLRQVLRRMAQRFEVLRTSIIYKDVEVFQQAITDRELPLHLYDVSDKLGEAQQSAIEEIIRHEIEVLGFDVEEDALWRLACIKTSENDCRLLIVEHHIISDGWSMQVTYAAFTQYLEESLKADVLPESEANNSTRTLSPEHEGKFEQFVRSLESKDQQEGLTYWQRILEGFDAKSVIPSYEQIPSDQQDKGEVSVTLPREIVATLHEVCHREEVTLNTAVELAWGMVLQCYNRTNDVLFVKVVSGRNLDEADGVCGICINSVPVRVSYNDDQTLREALKNQQLQGIETSRYDYIPLSEIQKLTPLKNHLFESIIAFENYETQDLDNAASHVGLQLVEAIEPNFNEISLVVQIVEEQGLSFTLNYNPARFRAVEMRRVLTLLEQSLSSISLMTQLQMAELPWVDKAEEQQILKYGAGKDLPIDKTQTFAHAFLQQAERTPDAVAVVDGWSQYTYGELSRLSGLLAERLVREGVHVNDFVCVMLDRRKEFVLSVLGIHRAGAAYVPIDPEYPEERRRYMLEDSQAKVLIDDAYIESFLQDATTDTTSRTIDLSSPDTLAYMIYTSGSTGQPKGAMLGQAGLWNFIQVVIDMEQLTSSDRIAGHRSFSFDAHIEDMYAVLTLGGSFHIMPSEIRKDIDDIYDFIVSHEITGGGYATAVATLMLNGFDDLPVRFMTAGGEKLEGVYSDHINIINVYGPTECTDDTSYYSIPAGVRIENIPIGRPVANTWNFITDSQGRLLPRGVAGELCIAGPQVGKGYWNKPELTAKAFFEYEIEGQKVAAYRTGDLCRWNEEGELEYLSRVDMQVKLRGFRIELGEIEQTAMRLSTINQVAAEVRKLSGIDHLILYYSVQEGAAISPEVLRQHMQCSQLTDYMVPEYYVPMEQLPLTPNGKIDRKRLPMPDYVAEKQVAPETPLEHDLFALVAELLHHEEFGITTNLISVGLTSLLAMRLSAAIMHRLGLDVSTRYILANPVIRQWCEELSATAVESSAPKTDYAVREYYPLTENQRGLYVAWEMNSGACMYNVPRLFRLKGGDLSRLYKALQQVCDAHPSVKTRLVMHDGEVMMQRQDSLPINVDIQVLLDAPGEDFFQSRVRPFNLLEEPLYRFGIYQSSDILYLFVDIHHIVYDGISESLFTDALQKAYGGELLQPESFTLFEHALDEAADAVTREEGDLYFDRLLSQGVCIPWPKSAQPDGDGCKEITCGINAANILECCRRHHITANSYFCTVLAQLMHRLTREDDLVFTTISNGRSDSRLSQSLGMFVQTLPFASDFSAEALHLLTTQDALIQMHHQLMDTYQHDSYPFSRIAERHGVKADIMLAYQSMLDDYEVRTAESPIAPVDIPLLLDTAKMSLTFNVSHLSDDTFSLLLEYDGTQYGRDDMKSLAMAFVRFAEGMAIQEYIRDVKTLNAEEEAAMYALAQGEYMEYDRSQNLIQLIQDQVRRTPDKVAVVFKNHRLTYREIDEKSDKLAHVLRCRYHIGLETVVGVMIERSELMVLYPLAIMKCGGIYMPLDFKFPADRLQFMCADAQVGLVVTDELSRVTQAMPGWQGLTVSYDMLLAAYDVCAGDYVETIVAQPQNAYVILYTSGSTGQPKGVLLEHKGIVNFCHWYCQEYDMVADDVTIAYANFGFDAHMMDIYPALSCGATVHVIPSEMRMELVELNDYFEENNVSIAFLTTQVGYMFATTIPNQSLRLLSVSGEKLLPCKKPPYRFYNAGGPTECTIYAFNYAITTEYYDSALIGRPMSNVQLYVMDREMHLLPKGIPGELVIGGMGVGRCYLNRPELTREKFLPQADGSRMYRAGDLVRWNEDGNLDYMGRIDNQVKMRGLRIELGEIEAQASKYEGISQVAVVVRKIGGVEHLVMYYTLDASLPTDRFSEEKLCNYLKSVLTDYMVPTQFMMLPEMPLNANGKINRKMLPEPTETLSEVIAPETEMEKHLFEIVSEQLKTDEFGVTNNLVSLGLTSIAAMRLSAKIFHALDIQIRMKDIMRNPTIRQLAEVAQELLGSDVEQKVLRDDNVPGETKDEYYPLTENQLGIYVDWEMHPESIQYNVPQVIRIESCKKLRLKLAIEQVVAAHPYLLTRLVRENDQVMQQRGSLNALSIIDETLSAEPEESFFDQRVRPFDLFADALCRFEIYESPTAVYLFIDIHHIIYDGLSVSILTRQVAEAYQGSKVQKENFDAYQHALNQQQILASARHSEATQYFDDLLSGISCVSYPHSAFVDGGEQMGVVSALVEMPCIIRWCQQEGVTENSFFLTVMAQLLHRTTREEALAFCTISNGRADLRLEESIGMFVQTLPVVSKCSVAEMRHLLFQEAVHMMYDQSLESIDRDFYPFTYLAQRHHLHAEILFAFQGGVMDGEALPGMNATSRELELKKSKTPITITIAPMADGKHYGVRCEYDASFYSRNDMQRLTEAIGRFAMEACQPGISLFEIGMLDDDRLSALHHLGQGKQTHEDTTLTVIDLFRQQVAATPDNLAVVYQEEKLTYRELDEISDRLAAWMQKEQHLEAGQVVGLCIDRSERMAIYPLAVMKAGGTYMPLDPHFPADRLKFMCQDAEVKLVLDDTLDLSQLPAEHPQPVVVAPEDAMVILFTSGTTGRPKGVVLQHRALLNFFRWYVDEFDMTAADRAVAYANFGFDAHMMDLYPAFICGASVWIIPSDMRMDVPALNDYMNANDLSIAFFTTQIGHLIATSVDNHSLRLMSVGGEKLQSLRKPEGYRFYNGYGPTECSLYSTFYNIEDHYDASHSCIGRPLPNYQLWVMDPTMHPVPQGVPGELCIGGRGLAREYLNRPELTAEKFIDYQGERLYRSGDLVRWSEDGNIEFLGRVDHQVKLRGLRIELEEIESQCVSFAGIHQAITDVRSVNGVQHLCLYYTVMDGQTDEKNEFERALQEHLSSVLTDYMVPTRYIRLETMPLNANGKINRHVFPDPAPEDRGIYVAPATDEERVLADKIAAVLNLKDQVSSTDSFFVLGGDSIKAIRLVSLLRDAGWTLTVSQIMKLRTVSAMAQAMQPCTSDVNLSQAPWSGEVPNSAIINWFESQHWPEPAHFNQSMMLSNGHRIDESKLRQALQSLVEHHDMLRAVYCSKCNNKD